MPQAESITMLAKKTTYYNKINGKKFRLYDPASDPGPIYSNLKEDDIADDETVNSISENAAEFAYVKGTSKISWLKTCRS
jgi:hypothetical protein